MKFTAQPHSKKSDINQSNNVSGGVLRDILFRSNFRYGVIIPFLSFKSSVLSKKAGHSALLFSCSSLNAIASLYYFFAVIFLVTNAVNFLYPVNSSSRSIITAKPRDKIISNANITKKFPFE